MGVRTEVVAMITPSSQRAMRLSSSAPMQRPCQELNGIGEQKRAVQRSEQWDENAYQKSRLGLTEVCVVLCCDARMRASSVDTLSIRARAQTGNEIYKPAGPNAGSGISPTASRSSPLCPPTNSSKCQLCAVVINGGLCAGLQVSIIRLVDSTSICRSCLVGRVEGNIERNRRRSPLTNQPAPL